MHFRLVKNMVYYELSTKHGSGVTAILVLSQKIERAICKLMLKRNFQLYCFPFY